MPKYTSGPWFVRFTLADWTADYQIASVVNTGPRSEREYLAECQANCQLIEAAPDLLAALDRLTRWHYMDDVGDMERERINADWSYTKFRESLYADAVKAIRKAKGE